MKDLRILQVSTYENAGGAERVAYDLFTGYRQRGYKSYLAVGRKHSQDPDVLVIPNPEKSSTPWVRFWREMETHHVKMPYGRLSKAVVAFSRAQLDLKSALGIENYDFPGTYQLLRLPPERPDILHAHNLHINYFDLRALPRLSSQVPFVLSLHDAWLLSGHCAHSFGCERWKTGCGHCPDLGIYPPLQRDATALNWRRKKYVYNRSRLYVATASEWLIKKVEQSILAPAIVDLRRIPYGVDLSLFHPAAKKELRQETGIPENGIVILVRANSLRKDKWKDFTLMRAVIDEVAKGSFTAPIIFLALGENLEPEKVGNVEIRFVPYQSDHRAIAKYYQLADFYIHPARADTFPLVVLEALACGLPVVATAVDGIPEQIVDGQTGFLAPAGDVSSMTHHVTRLIGDPDLRRQMGQNAAQDARRRFDQERHVSDYLAWYDEILRSPGRAVGQ